MFICGISVQGIEKMEQNLEIEMTPQYIYKVVSIEDWEASQTIGSVMLAETDHEFIHLATQDQLSRIIEKFWGKAPEYVILKIDTSKMKGKLVLEANPGGTNKYYHLYNGSIPLSAVVDAKTVKR